MRLLVSVANAAEASAALAGGADVIDAKDPLAGALGAVTLDTLREIRVTVAGARLVTAAIGDAADEIAVERMARAYAAAGAVLVKVGFGGITSASRIEALIRAAVRGVGSTGVVADSTGVVAVAYADADRVASVAAGAIVRAAARAGVTGVLLDTADKSGPGLRDLMTATVLAQWVAEAHNAGLLVAVAGKLTADDLGFARDAGADIAGVRGAACEGGRSGRVSSQRVALLHTLCNSPKGVMQSA